MSIPIPAYCQRLFKKVAPSSNFVQELQRNSIGFPSDKRRIWHWMRLDACRYNGAITRSKKFWPHSSIHTPTMTRTPSPTLWTDNNTGTGRRSSGVGGVQSNLLSRENIWSLSIYLPPSNERYWFVHPVCLCLCGRGVRYHLQREVHIIIIIVGW